MVCYVLGITAVDPIKFELPFERFLSTTREEEPDIDVDFDSDRREEVIQEVYRRYGRRNAAQVANVISYRPKSAVRDMAKALGYSTGQQDAWSKQIDIYASIADADHDVPQPVVDLANQLLKAPRHLGIHSGGMVLTERPVGEVCPIERGRMDARTVLQWDKDSCAAMGLVKFDFLGLGILAAIQYTLDLAADHLGERWTLHTMPKEEPGVYDMLCRADSIGVFQVESRAQIGTLPRLQPRKFYDLVVEIGLIRPGPIQGGAVHPYIRRATGREPVTYLHPALEPVLQPDPRRAAVPGAADADRHDHRRLHRRRRRPAAPGDGVQAGDREDRAAEGEAVRRDGRARHHRRAGRRHLHPDPGVRELRLRREPRDQLRPAGLRLVLAQAALPGGLSGRTAAGAADGLLLPAVAGGRRPAARRTRAPAGHRPVRGARRHWRARAGRPGRTTAWPRIIRRPRRFAGPLPTRRRSTAGTATSRSGWG